MDDAVMKRLRADRDKVERAAAAKEAEREERLAQTKAKGRAAGEAWVRNSAAYEPLKQLAAGSWFVRRDREGSLASLAGRGDCDRAGMAGEGQSSRYAGLPGSVHRGGERGVAARGCRSLASPCIVDSGYQPKNPASPRAAQAQRQIGKHMGSGRAGFATPPDALSGIIGRGGSTPAAAEAPNYRPLDASLPARTGKAKGKR